MFSHRKDQSEYRAFLKEIGSRLKNRRQELNLTQEGMEGEPFPFLVRDWQNVEYGRRNITIQTVFKICKKLKIQPGDLMDVKLHL
jgi:transcriptional regulator with XRE-family HTH domain